MRLLGVDGKRFVYELLLRNVKLITAYGYIIQIGGKLLF